MGEGGEIKVGRIPAIPETVEILPRSLRPGAAHGTQTPRSVAGATKYGAEEKAGHSGPFGFAQGRRDDGVGRRKKRSAARLGRRALQKQEEAKRAQFIVPLRAARPRGGWENLAEGWAHQRGQRLVCWPWGRSSRGPVLSFRYTSGGQRAAKVAPNHPGTATRSQTTHCEVRIEATTASSPECVCAGVGQRIECPDFTQKEKSQ